VRAADEQALDLLRRELAVAEVDWSAFLPWWAKSGDSGDAVLHELLIAVNAPVHEGHIPPYASIVVADAAPLSALVPLEVSYLDLARKAADGRATVVVFERNRFVGLLTLDASLDPDLALVRLAVKRDGVALHRNEKGHVRLYSPHGALRNIGRQWAQGPSLNSAVETIRSVAPEVDENVLVRLLEFAYFILSPRHIGATIVWLLGETNPFAGVGDDLSPLRLSTQDDAASRLLSFADHLLAQFDGATIMSRAGDVIATGIHLRATDRAQLHVKALPGTRHTSAKRGSFDHPDTLVVTISADGPVTVFSDGVSVFQLEWLSARDVAAARDESGLMVFTFEGVLGCDACGKRCELETLKAPGSREAERDIPCPVCGTVLATIRCSAARATVRKKL
jgi:DNA integrity scanning protein DisA with diadenylate cyclase activity